MGLFGKIKNIFYDEEIIEVPVEETKKEEKPKIEEVRMPLPKKEETKAVVEEVKPVAPVYTERELFKTETTFKFPVIDEEDDDEPIMTRTRANVLDMERKPKREVKETKPDIRFNERNTSDRNVERTFKPSPIISPVYGVLDKNYKKEEIIERQQQTIRHNPSDMNYDSVRRKAYGTLEDELENTLSRISESTEEISKTIDEVDKLDNEQNSKSIEDLLSEIEENRNVSIGEIEERIKDRIEEDEEEPLSFVKEDDVFVQEEPILTESEESEESEPLEEQEIGFDKTLEHDLFNLIDSMYEEREGE